MRQALRKARTLLTVYYAHMLEYRAEIVLWMLAGVFPFILMGVWMKAGESGQFSLDPVQFGRYFLAVFVVRQMTVVWVIWEFERKVVDGSLSPFLLQPIDPVWRHFAGHIAERGARLPFFVLLLGLFFLLQPQLFWLPSWRAAALASLAMALAFCLRFAIQYSLAMLCFWTERASAVQQFWFLIYLFLSGLLAPLQEFPEAVRDVAMWTPFPYLVYFPACLLVGLPTKLGQGFLVLSVWLLVFVGLNRVLWRQGLKHYSGMGA